ncbi:MAG TPA: hypothetical protein VKX17_28470 [Planctomycetota bacterium]|nr:hypothetical protein [Planctomycetota bacterium]
MRKVVMLCSAMLIGLAFTGCGDITVNNPPKRIIVEGNKEQPVIVEKTIVEKPVIVEKTTAEKPVIIEKR